jgi:hypothetical protein
MARCSLRLAMPSEEYVWGRWRMRAKVSGMQTAPCRNATAKKLK